MTCYFRHLGSLFDEIGIVMTPENKKEVDKVIHSLVHVTYKDCPATWKAIKARLAEDETAFLTDLRGALSEFLLS